MKERILFGLIGVVLFLSGGYALFTGAAGEKDYGSITVVGMEGIGVRVMGLVMAALGAYILYKEVKR